MILPLTTLLLALFAFSTDTAKDSKTEEQTIRSLDKAWSDALERHDLDTMMVNYAPDAVFLPPNAPIVTGRENIRARFEKRMQQPGYFATFWPTKVVVAKSADMAWEIGVFHAKGKNAQGREVVSVGKHLVTWQKIAGEWKVVAESINTDQ